MLPSFLFDILDAPVPYIAGINKGADHRCHPAGQSVLVLLDSGELLFPAEKPDSTAPKSELPSLFGRVLGEGGNLTPDTVADAIRTALLSGLPSAQAQRKEDAGLEDIKSRVVALASSEDKDFVAKFVETQMFTSYVEERYWGSVFAA